jgi:3-isopropylmalate dehydratase small subunit
LPDELVFEGRCWKFGDNVPTDDVITPTHVMFKTPREMAALVLETVNPEFPKHVKPGDIQVAGRNFGCSSGRALAATKRHMADFDVLALVAYADVWRSRLDH